MKSAAFIFVSVSVLQSLVCKSSRGVSACLRILLICFSSKVEFSSPAKEKSFSDWKSEPVIPNAMQ